MSQEHAQPRPCLSVLFSRLGRFHHCEQVTRNVSQTCRFFGISRSLFCIWRDRYRQDGLVGLRDRFRYPSAQEIAR